MSRKTRLVEGDKHASFVAVATDRTQAVILALKRLAKCGNRATYAPTETEIRAIMDAITAQLLETELFLKNGYAPGKGGFKL